MCQTQIVSLKKKQTHIVSPYVSLSKGGNVQNSLSRFAASGARHFNLSLQAEADLLRL